MFNFNISQSSNIDLIFLMVGGLSVFLFGLNITKENLKKLSSNHLNKLIDKCTDNNFKAFLTGLITTILIQSSSGVCAIAITLIASGHLTFKKGLGIMIGSNLGTCISSFLFGINIEEYSLIIIVIGALFFFPSKKLKTQLISQIIIGIGLLFLGLHLMGSAFEIMANQPKFSHLIIQYVNNNFISFLIGILITFIIQSSSAIIGVLEKIYASDLISLSPAILLILGSNIGTTLTSFISTINTNKDARKAVVANVLFNIIGAILFIIILPIFIKFLIFFKSQNIIRSKELMIAFAHLIFNLVSVILGYIFINQLINLTNFITNEKKKNHS